MSHFIYDLFNPGGFDERIYTKPAYFKLNRNMCDIIDTFFGNQIGKFARTAHIYGNRIVDLLGNNCRTLYSLAQFATWAFCQFWTR